MCHIDVEVYRNEKLGGMTWDRFYRYANNPLNRVTSTKCILPEKGLIEVVGFGFGMHLKIFEENTALVFESTGFFWQFKGLKVAIPNILTPGKTRVWQEAISDSQFHFNLRVIHPLLGKVFWQTGVFNDPAG